jgi:16S rRNA (guanine527-N7)-methyltransferase
MSDVLSSIPVPAIPDAVRAAIESIVPVSRETWDRLSAYVSLLVAESAEQNLIAASTVDTLWERHILDSAQLVAAAISDAGSAVSERHWLDIGSGAGLPGIVIAILTGDPVTLVEPRRRRVEFLERVVRVLDLKACHVVLGKVERLPARLKFDVITARAVAPLEQLFGLADHLTTNETMWILPKGKNAIKELEQARDTWQGVFTLIPSQTSAEGGLIIARQVRPKGKANRRP